MVTRSLVLLLALGAGVACDFPTGSSTPAGKPSVASYAPRRFMINLGAGAITSEPGASVSMAFFKDVKTPPLLGRAFLDEDLPMAVVVLGYGMWKERFDSEPSIIGEQVVIDDRRMIVVGIMPESFAVPEGARLWVKR